MKHKPLLGALFIGSAFLLTGCEPQPTGNARNWVDVPTLPIIQESVLSLRPDFAGPNAKQLIGYICAMARGEATQEQVNNSLRGAGIDPTKLPSEGSAGLLVNGNRAVQTAACAAYIAVDAQTPANLAEVTVQVPAEEEGKPPVTQVDGQRLNQVLRVKLAEARATADVFALISTELKRNPGKSVEEYRALTNQLFTRLAPVLLERVKQQLPPASVSYHVERIQPDALSFTTSTGASYSVAPGMGLTLRQNGVTWYGEGKLLGQPYSVPVAYFPTSVNALLASPGKS